MTDTSTAHLAGLAAGIKGQAASQCPHSSGQDRTDWIAGHTEGSELAAGIAADRANIAAMEQARANIAQSTPGQPLPASNTIAPPWAQTLPQRGSVK